MQSQFPIHANECLAGSHIEQVRAPSSDKVNARVPSQCIGIELLVIDITKKATYQLLSYHVALIKGADVGKPRNMAKSVTVE